MLDKANVFYAAREASQLMHSSKFQVSRSLRRFLESYTVSVVSDVSKRDLMQSFAFENGYNRVQLNAMEAYANQMVTRQAEFFAEASVADALVFHNTVRDDSYGIVLNHYQLAWNPSTASLKQLQRMVHAVAIIAHAMQAVVANVNDEALQDCPTYRVRGLPCSITTDDKLWMVSGHDKLGGGSGVLEWCYDKDDAEHVFAAMNRFPERFPGLKVGPFADASAWVAA